VGTETPTLGLCNSHLLAYQAEHCAEPPPRPRVRQHASMRGGAAWAFATLRAVTGTGAGPGPALSG
jgi:hypothetical protein